jgi:peptidoglycan/LPS O-acetylase OafA/YrhL
MLAVLDGRESPTHPTGGGAGACSLSNAGWAVCVAFVIWLTAYGRGSLVEYLLGSHVWEPLARLTFGAYLVHPLIIVAEQVPVILCALVPLCVPCVCPVGALCAGVLRVCAGCSFHTDD